MLKDKLSGLGKIVLGSLVVALCALPARPEDLSPQAQKCLTEYTSLVKSGLIRDADFNAMTPVVIVDEDVWRTTEFQEKAKLGDLMHCLFAPADPNASPRIAWYETEFRSNMTNKVLGKLRWGKLKESE